MDRFLACELPMDIAVLISAYNNAPLLRRCLLALTVQTDANFQVVIADDGSNESVKNMLARPEFRQLAIEHHWQEDQGFRKTRILNRALAAMQADYVILTDADCLPRNDFIAQHRAIAKPGTFVSGGIVNIPIPVHEQFTDDDLVSQRVFDVRFLAELDPSLSKQRGRLARPGRWTPLWNMLTYRYAALRGNNAAIWRDDLVAVNGFDEGFVHHGSEDRDLGQRLSNYGCRGRMLKYSVLALHMDHKRPYFDPAASRANRERSRQRFWSGQSWVESGINKAA
jgi:glycosyltransferase involved in cell wall biosynthesis